jgi:hypothetical protein|eukprot:COSAG03_NODE_886_length_5486_cov_6.922591_7_plen_59_part_00
MLVGNINEVSVDGFQEVQGRAKRLYSTVEYRSHASEIGAGAPLSLPLDVCGLLSCGSI